MVGTPYQQALVSQEVQLVADGDRYRLFAPVADRGDALGVLELVSGTGPTRTWPGRVASAAHALAYVVIANRRHTDLFESVQRNAPSHWRRNSTPALAVGVDVRGRAVHLRGVAGAGQPCGW